MPSECLNVQLSPFRVNWNFKAFSFRLFNFSTGFKYPAISFSGKVFWQKSTIYSSMARRAASNNFSRKRKCSLGFGTVVAFVFMAESWPALVHTAVPFSSVFCRFTLGPLLLPRLPLLELFSLQKDAHATASLVNSGKISRRTHSWPGQGLQYYQGNRVHAPIK